MAEAALDYDQLLDQPPLEIPPGGIANFLTATSGSWADDEDIPRSGIAEVKKVADKLAEYGRHEDEYMVHAAEGETVVPMAVFEKNPKLKENLFEQMRMMGIDPERYVVGNELNSINPVTGQPEFFLKKMFRGIKKVFKKVVHVVLPVVLNAISGGTLGLIGSAALGSGIITLSQGGSFGDALKSAALGGAAAGLFKGIQGGISGARSGEGFGAGFREGLVEGLPSGARGRIADRAADRALAAEQAEATRLGKLTPEIDTSVTPDLQVPGADVPFKPTEQNVFGPPRDVSVGGEFVGEPYVGPDGTVQYTVQAPRVETFFEPLPKGMTQVTQADLDSIKARPRGQPSVLADQAPIDQVPTGQLPVTVDQAPIDQPNYSDLTRPQANYSEMTRPQTQPTGRSPSAAATGGVTDIDTRGFGESIRDAFTPGDDKGILSSLRQAFLPQTPSLTQVAESIYGKPLEALTSDQLGIVRAKRSELVPNMFRRYAPLMGAGMVIGKINEPDEIEVDLSGGPYGRSGFDLLRQNPEAYTVDFNLPTYGRAMGGSIDSMDFPPKIGAIYGPGTETSDDVPAMLSDGEFVMTAEAVRGAGNGSREAGMNTMYNLMRNFERVA